MRCNQQLLRTLVEQHVEVEELPEPMAIHIEQCDHCQNTLAMLAGNSTWWKDLNQMLSDSPQCLQESPLNRSSEWADDIDLSFLGTPIHPELLGRIGRYDVEGVLGRGGMGMVLRGYDTDLRRTVAIKVLSPELARCEVSRNRFAREAQAAAGISHENVVPIYNVQTDEKHPYLVMPYLPGMTLQQFIAENGPPDTGTLLRIAAQLADGLVAAHERGLIHRDIKPANVLLGENVERVWLTDFGLARAVDDATMTQTGVIAGTPHYMSPEQARGSKLDYRSDLFSLGGVLHFLCTGEPPFIAENPLAVLHQVVSSDPEHVLSFRSDLPPSLVSLVDRLLAKSEELRPSSAVEVRKILGIAQAEFQQGHTKSLKREVKMSKNFAVGMLLVGVSIFLVAVAFWPSATEELERSYVKQADVSSPPIASSPTFIPEPSFDQIQESPSQRLLPFSHFGQQLDQVDEQVESWQQSSRGFEIVNPSSWASFDNQVNELQKTTLSFSQDSISSNDKRVN